MTPSPRAQIKTITFSKFISKFLRLPDLKKNKQRQIEECASFSTNDTDSAISSEDYFALTKSQSSSKSMIPSSDKSTLIQAEKVRTESEVPSYPVIFERFAKYKD